MVKLGAVLNLMKVCMSQHEMSQWWFHFNWWQSEPRTTQFSHQLTRKKSQKVCRSSNQKRDNLHHEAFKNYCSWWRCCWEVVPYKNFHSKWISERLWTDWSVKSVWINVDRQIEHFLFAGSLIMRSRSQLVRRNIL